MKNKYILILVLTAFLAACTDRFEDFNTDQKAPAKVAGEALFSNAQKGIADQSSSSSVNLNIWKLFSQYWTETTYVDEANYDIVTRTIPDGTYATYYRGFLKDLLEASTIIEATPATSAVGEVEKANKLAIIELTVAYAYQQLVDIFGDIPYSEALDVQTIHPKYDDAASIYTDLIARVTAAVAGLDDSEGSFGNGDLFYGGDVSQWKKFGNGLKIKLGIALADVDPATARSTVEAAYTAGTFTSNADNALFVYQTASPNYNQLYADLVASGRKDFVAANTIIDAMNTLADPRMAVYFTQTDTSSDNNVVKLAYVGGTYGESSPYALYSHVGDVLLDPTFPGIIMTYDEVAFYLAEAAARGWTVGGTAEEWYNAGIEASFDFWGVSGAAAYLAKPEVAYATAAGEWQEKIGTQAWISLYTRGLEAYTTWRRLDYPILNLPPTITEYSEIPVRFTYPVNEQTLNEDNWTDAAAAIGGDATSTLLFWDAAIGGTTK